MHHVMPSSWCRGVCRRGIPTSNAEKEDAVSFQTDRPPRVEPGHVCASPGFTIVLLAELDPRQQMRGKDHFHVAGTRKKASLTKP